MQTNPNRFSLSFTASQKHFKKFPHAAAQKAWKTEKREEFQMKHILILWLRSNFAQESAARIAPRESREEIAVDFVKSKSAQPIMIMRGKIWIFLSHHDLRARSEDNTRKK